MHGHQGHLVARVLLVIPGVGVAEQGHVLEVVVQGEKYAFRVRLTRRLRLGPSFLHEYRHRIHQFLYVGRATLAFDRIVGLEERVQAAVVGNLFGQLVCVRGLHQQCQLLYHLAEGFHLRDLEARPEQGQLLLPRHKFQRLQGGGAYAPCRFVHRALEGLVVVGVHAQLEVRHHILDFRPLVERVAGINHVRDVAPAQLLLYGTGLRIGAVEHCKVLILSVVVAHPGHYLPHHGHCFLGLRIAVENLYLLACVAL